MFTSIVCPIFAVCNCNVVGSMLIVALGNETEGVEGVGEGVEDGFIEVDDAKCE